MDIMKSKFSKTVSAVFCFALVVTCIAGDETPKSVAEEKIYVNEIQLFAVKGFFSEIVDYYRRRVDRTDFAIVYASPEYYPGIAICASNNQGAARLYRISPSDAGLKIAKLETEMSFADFVSFLQRAKESEIHDSAKGSGNPFASYEFYICKDKKSVEFEISSVLLKGMIPELNNLLFRGDINKGK